MTLPATES